jgi:uncharacterized protein (DUF58 family)
MNPLDALLASAAAAADVLGPLRLATPQAAAFAATGSHGRRRAGPGVQFWQFRALSPGETVERVDWRRSARSDALYVRTQEWEAPSRLLVWVDGAASLDYASRDDLPTKRRRALQLGVALAQAASAAEERVGALGGAHGPPGSGSAAVRRLAMALTAPAPTAEPPELAAAPPGSHVILFSDWLGGMEALSQAPTPPAGVMVHMVQVSDPAERDFPFASGVLLRDVSGSTERRLHDPKSLRAAYLERWRAHQERLQAFAASRGWRLVDCATQDPVSVALSHLAEPLRQAASGA